MPLNRYIKPVSLTFIAVGGMVGSGWIFGPLITANIAGPASLVAWGLGGLAMFILALSYAEISSIIPVAGGIARLPIFSHGKLTAVAMGWTAWLGYNITAAIETIAMLDYLATFFPALKTPADIPFELSLIGMLVAVLLLAFFVFINALGVLFFARTNSAMTAFKVAIPVIIALSLLYWDFNPGNFTDYGGFMPSGWTSVFSAIATGGIVFSFIGFRHAIDMAGETKNPQRTIPLALTLSLFICLLIYELLQLAFIGAVDPQDLLASGGWQQLQMNHHMGPLARLVMALGITWLTILLYVGVVTVPAGAALVSTGSNGRLAFALAEDEFFPSYFTKLSAKGVPLHTMLLNLVIGGLVVFFLPFKEAVALNGATLILSFSIGPIALYCFRKQFPDINRRFQLPYVSVFAIAGFCVASLIIYWSGWNVFVVMVAILLLGLFVFVINTFVYQHNWRDVDYKNALWLLPYIVGLGIFSYIGNYGGKELVAFPIDNVFIILFSVAIFYLATYLRLNNEQALLNLSDAFENKEREKLGIFDEKVP